MPDVFSQRHDMPIGLALDSTPHPGGVTAHSRWSSAATPPVLSAETHVSRGDSSRSGQFGHAKAAIPSG